MFCETVWRCRSPLLRMPVLLVPGPDAVARPSLTAVSRPSLPPSSARRCWRRSGPGAPRRIDELDPVAGGVDLGGDVHVRGGRLAVDVVDHVLQRHGACQG